MSETLTYDSATETVTTESNLTAEEQDSLKVGEEMKSQEEQLLAGKYKNAEELEKAHIELQKKLGEKSSEDSKEEVSEKEPEAKKETETKQNIIDRVYEEGTKNKKIPKELIDELRKTKPEELAKMALQYKQEASKPQQQQSRSLTEKDVSNIHNVVGGKDNYNNMMSWASGNLKEQEINMFDAVMDRGDMLGAYFAVKALAYRYQDAVGKDGQMLTGKAPKSVANAFKSQAELVKAMEDPRYNDDPAYRQEVQAKLERSNINF